jgi:hypothetical protein
MTAPATLAEALAALQAVMPRVAKEHTAKVETRTGGNYKYSYADLTDCTAALYPVMAQLGLSFTACPTIMEDGRFALNYRLTHVSGEDIGGQYPLPDPALIGPQDLGKAITYARRYALCAVTGLAPGGDDDDAQAAQHAQKPRNVPDAQLAAEGRMTRRDASAHDRLKADTLRGGKKADRTRPKAPDPEDPWAADAPVNGARAQELRQDLTDPEDKPGSCNDGQRRAIERMLTFVGTDPKDRDSRHEMVSGLLDLRPPIEHMTDLTYAQAADLIKLLNEEAAKIRERARA